MYFMIHDIIHTKIYYNIMLPASKYVPNGKLVDKDIFLNLYFQQWEIIEL